MASLAPVPGPSGNVRLFAQPRPGRAKLRVGVFADAPRQPRWLVEALAKVAASDFAELVFVAIPHRHHRGQTTCPADRNVLPGGTSGLSPVWSPVWRAYRAVDRWAFGNGSDGSELASVELLVPVGRRIAGTEGVADARLDVAFVLGDVDDTALEGSARFGTWRYCFGEGHHALEPLAGVHEVIDGTPVTAIGIRIHRGGGAADRIASVSWSRTVPFSFARTRAGLMPKAADFLARTLRDLHGFGPAWLEQATEPARDETAPTMPRGAALLGGLARVAARVAQRAAERQLTIGQWQLAFRFARHEPWTGSLDGFFRLAPPKDRFWADPFPIEVQGRHYIFFEELAFGAGKAHISVIEVDREGRASQPVRVLERDYHLSYPFLVEDEGRLYMIPESAHNRTVEIYRCVEFPHRWKLERTLLRDLWCADATLHRGAGRWWMFATIGRDGGEINDELNLFHAERLLGDWKPHRRNPVRSDVRGARPAGRLFQSNGKLYRPGQVCTPIYGAAIALNRVTRLDEADFAEEEERRIVPWGPGAVLGMHTINRAGSLSVTDFFVRRPKYRP